MRYSDETWRFGEGAGRFFLGVSTTCIVGVLRSLCCRALAVTMWCVMMALGGVPLVEVGQV